MGSLHEKCAVAGVSLREDEGDAAQQGYRLLFALQHRGVEGSGMAALNKHGTLSHIRAPGMVRDVYTLQNLAGLEGDIVVGHNRYSTSGGRNAHIQPVKSSDIGFAFAHNGNIPDTTHLEDYLEKRRYRTARFNDSEMFGKALASKLHGGRSIEEAVAEVQDMAIGAYACVAAYDDTLFAFRDPHGIRPLEIGHTESGITIASESCALDSIGAEWLRSVAPGELVIARNGVIESTHKMAEPTPHFDMFELVYFARHDSYLAGQRVNEVRRRFGESLAELHPPVHGPEHTVVVPVPDTSTPAAEGYASATGLPHEAAIIKNRYVGRTFMQPSQDERKRDLGRKHTMITERVKGRHVYLVDDSIVRGNTMPRLVELARSSGALSVTVLVSSPPVRFPDFYGIDTPKQSDLMAANMTVEEMRKEIGADYLGFLTVDKMVEATGMPASYFNLAPFTGEYPVDIGRQRQYISNPVSMEYVE